uniref:NADH-ubiquinone oxidoreductase chain 4L n=1 Tax=Magnusiomyces tetraspermus TaxID=1232584 RepID=A0A023UP65_9ASCO|nr:NADH dehydrogenase subunit 4L [Magnusiomyces tetraspermus]AHY04941.1 NADH dehydrogenase subunit 4L [Magnusiomyces tetraspermus]
MVLSITTFTIGFTGFVFNRKSMITTFISIEIMTTSTTTNITNTAFAFEDVDGTVFSIIIIIIAGAESAIGTSITVSYYRLRGNVSIEN